MNDVCVALLAKSIAAPALSFMQVPDSALEIDAETAKLLICNASCFLERHDEIRKQRHKSFSSASKDPGTFSVSLLWYTFERLNQQHTAHCKQPTASFTTLKASNNTKKILFNIVFVVKTEQLRH